MKECDKKCIERVKRIRKQKINVDATFIILKLVVDRKSRSWTRVLQTRDTRSTKEEILNIELTRKVAVPKKVESSFSIVSEDVTEFLQLRIIAVLLHYLLIKCYLFFNHLLIFILIQVLWCHFFNRFCINFTADQRKIV